MYSGLKIYAAGLIISFLGSLPMGTLNVTAMQIAIQENVRKALVFALGVALVELIYVRLSLKGIDFILANKKIFHFLEWATVFLFAVLAFSSFYAASRSAGQQKNLLLKNSVNRFWLGISMSAVNPAQVPFWFLWSSYLFSIRLLEDTSLAFNVYTLGIATGTVSGLLLFIYGGKWLVIRLNTGQKMLNIIVGIVFLISAIIQLVRVLQEPLENRLKSGTTRTVHLRPHSAYSAFHP
jgi:threonine/homoserine/homoserine lactone efflux protein